MRKMVSVCALAMAFIATLSGANQFHVQAQGPDGSSGGITSDGGAGGGAGGAAMADFDTLMNLIQQTVDPDGWLAAGGQSTMLPYPAGVYVAPGGNMKVVRADVELPELHLTEEDKREKPWLAAAQSRVVSLKQLDRAIFDAATGKSKPTAALASLAGLARIDYVRIDAENEDILLCGPSGDPAMGFRVEDVAVIAALINRNTSPLGCSIDPTDAGVRSVQALLSKPGAMKRLSQSPGTVAKEMQAALGNQKITVFGISPKSSTAIVLVDADAHMKKVGFGIRKTRADVPTYFDHVNKQRTVPKQSLVRWWFAYGDSPVKVNTAGDTFQLPSDVVTVLSEQQWMTAAGRAPSGGKDPAADAFARGFSERIGKLRASHPSYARLCAVFETALSLQLALDKSGQADLKAWLPNLCGLGALNERRVNEPKSVEGIATAKRLASGTVVAVVSGGVQADVVSTAKGNLEVSKFLSSTVIPDRPEADLKSWYWTGD